MTGQLIRTKSNIFVTSFRPTRVSYNCRRPPQRLPWTRARQYTTTTTTSLLFSPVTRCISGSTTTTAERLLLLRSLSTYSPNKQSRKKKNNKHPTRTKKRKWYARPRDDETGERLYRADRVLANRTGKTRNECFDLLKHKQVWTSSIRNKELKDIPEDEKIKLKGPKEKILMNAPLWIQREGKVPDIPPKMLVYHKPKWVLSTLPRADDSRKSIRSVIQKYSPTGDNLHAVGRLDYDTSGLLLLSSDGKITQSILHPKFHIEKEYLATVVGNQNVRDTQELIQQLQQGVPLVDITEKKKQRKQQAKKTTKDTTTTTTTTTTQSTAKFYNATGKIIDIQSILPHDDDSILNVDEYIDNIIANLPKEYNRDYLKERGYFKMFDIAREQGMLQIRLVVTEGKYRMVRRMLANAGYPVISLERLRIGPIQLLNSKQQQQSISSKSNNEEDESSISNNEDEEDTNDNLALDSDLEDDDELYNLKEGCVRELFPHEKKWIQTILKK